MAVRTKQLVLHELAAGDSDDLLYTAPDGRTTILKDFAVQNNSVGAVLCNVYVKDGSLGVGVFAQSVLSSTVALSTGRFVVMEPGQELHIATGDSHATGVILIAVSGAELDGVA